jgi:iron complex outermembrane recepter protein
MTMRPNTKVERLLPAVVATLLLVASTGLRAQVAPAASNDDTSATKQAEVVLDPFTVSTSKDHGYVATNAISGSRVDTPIKDIPISMQIVTSEFISDIGATDLRGALTYTSNIMLMTQNDLENTAGTYGSPYGAGGVNNPQGLTSNIDQVQLKIRGFVTTNTLRDGFLRGSSTDSVNIDRVEVVEGPNALLYGTGNFGGVVDYLTKQPLDHKETEATLSVGTYGDYRATIDDTGPISAANHLNYRLSGSWEESATQIQYQKNSHYFLAPTVSWEPTPTTKLVVDTEYANSKQNGYSFQAFRAVEGDGATPINNDQIEAVAFYFPPGANPRTFNLSGPDTYNNQQESNIEVKLTQRILKESTFLPELNVLLGFNRSNWAAQVQNLNGQITGPISPGQPGYNLATTIYTSEAANSIGGQGSDNLNLVFGPLPAAVDKYNWYQQHSDTLRDQERAEITGIKSLFGGHWYALSNQFLAGYSEIYNQIKSSSWETTPNLYSYKNPTDLSPIVFGKQGDGTADPAMFENDYDNINKGWDAGYYINDYAKLFNDRVIIMSGFRHDKNDAWSTDTQVAAPGAAPSTTSSRSNTVTAKSYQNGIMIEITKHLSIYGLKSEGINPNFGGLHNAVNGAPVTDDYAKSREMGIKFDFLDGKISGTLSHYTITKTAWVTEPWFTPAPLGNPHFNPSKDIVYDLSGGFNSLAPGSGAVVPAGWTGGNGQGYLVQPNVVSAWNAAVAAGAIYTVPGGSGLYIDASKPAGAAYMDAAFAANQADNGANWPGWLYNGVGTDPNVNNATEDAAGFINGPQNAAYQVTDRSTGWDGQLFYTPNEHIQMVLGFSLGQKVTRINLGAWPKYPYPQDRWAVWYFQNGSWGLENNPLNVVYSNPSDTSTRTNAGVFPGDDTPKSAVDYFITYKFGNSFGSRLNGLSVGAGVVWHSQEEFFSGVTHGSGQVEQNAAGLPIVAYSPSQALYNMFAKYEWKAWGKANYVQLNVNNVTNDQKLYGLIYSSPITAKLTYGIKF